MSIPAHLVESARDVGIDDVAAKCGLKLKRSGHELVGSCPRCGGDDRFSVHPRKEVFNCRQCGGKGHGAIDLAMFAEGLDFLAAVEMLTGASARHRRKPAQSSRPAVTPDDEAYARQQAHKAAWLWEHRQPLACSIAETYLREARGYGGPLPPTLGFLPPREDKHPAMIAAFAMAQEIEPTVLGEPSNVASVHLTLLKIDGSGKADVKPNKIIVGSPAGRPITLAPVNDLLGLAVTEGIEDGLSVAWSLGLGTWAAGAAGFMPALADTVPGYVGCCTIFGHADQAGRRGARALADRLVARGLEVFIEGV
jgi:putative DNA primase/helicase